MYDPQFTVTRQPADLSAPESVVHVWTHADRTTARRRAVSHAQRLARLDAGLSHPATYRVRIGTGPWAGHQVEAVYPPQTRLMP